MDPQRDTPAIAVLADRDHGRTAATMDAVAATVASGVPLLLVQRHGTPEPPVPAGGRWSVEVVAQDDAGTLARFAAGATDPADLVLVEAGVIVAAGWLERLVGAARDSLTGTVSALHRRDVAERRGGVLEIESALPLEEAAARMAAHTPTHPRIPAPAGGVVLVPRRAIEVIGGLDAEAATFADLLARTGERVVRAGLVNVVADDVLVAGPSPAATPDDERTIPLTRALAGARRAAGPLSVTVDGRVLSGVSSGTQVHTLGLVGALAGLGDIRVRLIVPPDLHPDAAARIALPNVAAVSYREAVEGVRPTAIVHRPQQVNTTDDLNLLLPLGDRLVVTQQDLIGYRNPAYHDDAELWLRHRRATRHALGLADRVLFLSSHALADAVAEDLVDPGYADVVGLGVDDAPAAVPQRPDHLRDDLPFLLCLGADLRHKNRLFALALAGELLARGWDGRLVLAGPAASTGGSTADEDAVLAADPELRRRVVRLGSVSTAEKLWLTAHAAAVLFPTVDEGFGLVPFEAAQVGVPCAFAPQGSLTEVAPAAAALLVPWDPAASAARLLPVLHEGTPRTEHVEALRAAAARHTWAATATATATAYERALASPRRAVTFEARDRADDAGELERLRAFREAVGEDGANLVGPPHPLLEDADRRALLAVLTRPALRGSLLASLRALYRLGHRR